MSTVNAVAPMLTGPGSSYTSVGKTVPSGSTVSAWWEEDGYYYILYTDSDGGVTYGYVATSLVTLDDYDGLVSAPAAYAKRWNSSSSSTSTYYGPGTGYTRAGSIDGYEQVYYLGKTSGGYAFIEYCTSSGNWTKRAWVASSSLATSDPSEEEEPTLSSISATYTGGSVPVGTSVSSLTGITVKATYSDGSTATVTGYTLSGTIQEGTNTITVSYSGSTTTFTVIGYVDDSGDDSGGGSGDDSGGDDSGDDSGGTTTSGTGVYIYDGSEWVNAVPYIHNGSTWVQATTYIHSDGWVETNE